MDIFFGTVYSSEYRSKDREKVVDVGNTIDKLQIEAREAAVRLSIAGREVDLSWGFFKPWDAWELGTPPSPRTLPGDTGYVYTSHYYLGTSGEIRRVCMAKSARLRKVRLNRLDGYTRGWLSRTFQAFIGMR